MKKTNSEKDKPMLFVCGLGWSGSSAAKDIICENDMFYTPKGGEIIFYKGLSTIASKTCQGKITHRHSFDLHLLLGRTPFFLPLGARQRVQKKTKKILDELRMTREEYDSFAAPFAKKIIHQTSKKEFDEAKKTIFDYTQKLDEKLSKKRICVYDNAVMPPKTEIAHILEEEKRKALFVFVIRDPRDQLIEHINTRLAVQSNLKKALHSLADYTFGKKVVSSSALSQRLLANAFIKDQKEKINRLKSLADSNRNYVHSYIFSFEELVERNHERERLRTIINNNYPRAETRWNLGSIFSPERSIKNTDKWKGQIDKAVAHQVKKEIDPLLENLVVE